jgi:NAD(P)-dependent dehydrogenase (short-subunit alcohol dehydrogenase family)
MAGAAALVTGATSGIGREIALQLAARGAEVVVHGRNAERGAKTVQDIENAGGKARFVAADLNDADDVRRLAGAAGPVDILINNAGIYKFGGTVDVDDATFDEHVNVNLRAPFILVQELVPGMVGRGGGAVVNISTVAASVPTNAAGIYGASKAGLEQLTQVWADEFGRTGVRVNAVAAGPTDTPGTAGVPEVLREVAETTTLRRVAEASEIANAVVFLSSEDASYINGAVLHATGGQRAIAV